MSKKNLNRHINRNYIMVDSSGEIISIYSILPINKPEPLKNCFILELDDKSLVNELRQKSHKYKFDFESESFIEDKNKPDILNFVKKIDDKGKVTQMW